MCTKGHSKWMSVLGVMSLLGLVLPGSAGGDPVILPLGDSITGIDPSEFPDHDPNDPAFQDLGRYREHLWDLLTADGYTVEYVGTETVGSAPLPDDDHEGHGGYRIEQVHLGYGEDGTDGEGNPDGFAHWLSQIVAGGETPNLVLLMAGTNNILQGQSYRNDAPGDMSNLIDDITLALPSARVLVSSIPPLTFPDPDWNDRVETFNATLPGIVSQKAGEGKNVEFVDSYAAMDASDISSDDIHPTEAGYDKIATAYYQKIVPEPTTVALLASGGSLVIVFRRRRKTT